MKIFPQAEIFVRAKRRKLVDWLMGSRWLRRRHQAFFGKDVIDLTMKCGDETFTFQPRELIGRNLYVGGEWQKELVKEAVLFLKTFDLVKPGKCVVELGANIGTQSVYLMKSGFFDRIVAVEAHPSNYRLLVRNLEQNGFADRSTALNVAVAPTDGVLELHTSAENEGGHSAVVRHLGGHSIQVPARTIGSIAGLGGLEADDIGFFWIDIEGMEFEVLENIVATLGSGIPVLMEFSPQFYGKAKTAEFRKFLEQHYEFFVPVPYGTAGREPIPLRNLPVDQHQRDILIFNMP